MFKNLGDDTHDTGVGTAGTSVVATEYGDGKSHMTKLVITALAQTIGTNATLAVGALIYTFPAGIIAIDSAGGSVAMTIVFATKTDTPEVGLGTVIASTAVATLGAAGSGTFENIAGPHVMDDVNGTAEVLDSNVALPKTLVIPTASAHTVFLNWADIWVNASGEDNSTIEGTVWLDWTLLA